MRGVEMGANAVRTVGGAAEVFAGAAYTYATGGLGGWLGGGALMANGADNLQAGWNSLRTGSYQQAYLEKGITSVAGNGALGNGLYVASQFGIGFGAPAMGSKVNGLLESSGKMVTLEGTTAVPRPNWGERGFVRLPGTDETPLPSNTATQMGSAATNSGMRQRVLENIAESARARSNSGFAETSRRWTALDAYEAAGWPAGRIEAHLKGIDFSKPVRMVDIPAGTPLVQYQILGFPVGNYFAPLGTAGNSLGFYTGGRVPTIFSSGQNVKALETTAADILDTWSVPGWSIDAPGGGTQFFVPDPSAFSIGR